MLMTQVNCLPLRCLCCDKKPVRTYTHCCVYSWLLSFSNNGPLDSVENRCVIFRVLSMYSLKTLQSNKVYRNLAIIIKHKYIYTLIGFPVHVTSQNVSLNLVILRQNIRQSFFFPRMCMNSYTDLCEQCLLLTWISKCRLLLCRFVFVLCLAV